MKNEGARGAGENVLDKTTRKDYREGQGLLRDIRLLPLILCNISLLLPWVNPFNT